MHDRGPLLLDGSGVCVGWRNAFCAGVLKLSYLTSELSLDPNLPSLLSPLSSFFLSSLSLSPLCAPLSLQCSFFLSLFPWGRGHSVGFSI